MKIRPLQDRVVVKRQDEETTSAGGIVLPGSATEKPQQGEVVAVGPGKRTEDGKSTPVDLKVGDHVVFGQYGGNTVKIDGDEYLILNESESVSITRDGDGGCIVKIPVHVFECKRASVNANTIFLSYDYPNTRKEVCLGEVKLY